MSDQTPVTLFLNRNFGGMATRILHAFHQQPYDPRAPITDAFAMELLVTALLVAFFLLVRATLSVEEPGFLQQAAEVIHGFVSEQASSIIGPHSARYVMFITCVLVFILAGNLIGLVPGLVSPTATPTVTLGVALLVFLYYNFHGLREQGPIGHAKHFLGPVWWISWMMLPIEIISHLARILSLSVRLYANMFAGEMVTLVFFSLIPVAVPVIFLGLHLGVSLIQAYIFMLLTMIYVSQAVAAEH